MVYSYLFLVFNTLPPPPYFNEITSGVCSEWRACSHLNSLECCPDRTGVFDMCCCIETDMLVNFDITVWNNQQINDGQQGMCCQREAIQHSVHVTNNAEFDVYCKIGNDIEVIQPQWWEGDNFLIIVIAGSSVLVILIVLLYFLFRELTPEQVDSIAGLVTAVGGAVSESTDNSNKRQLDRIEQKLDKTDKITNIAGVPSRKKIPTASRTTNIQRTVRKPNPILIKKPISVTKPNTQKVKVIPQRNTQKVKAIPQLLRESDNIIIAIQELKLSKKRNIELIN
jgi:hypothetical protein